MTIEFVGRWGMCGSLKAEGFGDGKCQRNHPQAALEAATQSYKDDLKIHARQISSLFRNKGNE